MRLHLPQQLPDPAETLSQHAKDAIGCRTQVSTVRGPCKRSSLWLMVTLAWLVVMSPSPYAQSPDSEYSVSPGLGARIVAGTSLAVWCTAGVAPPLSDHTCPLTSVHGVSEPSCEIEHYDI